MKTNNRVYDYKGPKDNWYTYRSIIDYARGVMGSIDLDPATTKEVACFHDIPNYFDEEQDGLKQKWFGNVWLNPPFSQKKLWVEKAVEELRSERVNNIMLLLSFVPENKMFHNLILGRSKLHFPSKRIRFYHDNGNSRTVVFSIILIELKKNNCNEYEMFNTLTPIEEVKYLKEKNIEEIK